jgi:hypothetical protein
MHKVTFPFLKTLLLVFGVLLLATNVALAQVSVSLPNVVLMAGTTRTINVTVGTLPKALSVLSYQFNLTYDSTVIRIIGYTTAGTITAMASTPVVVREAGVVRVAVASDSALSGSGALISFTADIIAPGTTPLTLTGFKFNEGNPTAIITNGQVVVPTLSVSLPASDTFKVVPATVINIPIKADVISGKGIQSYQFTVSYDTSLLTITGVSATGTSSAPLAGNIVVNKSVAGRISVAAASTDTASLAGADGATLINLTAHVKPNAHGTSALTFVNFQFNEGVPAVGAVNGSVYVQDVWAIRVIDRVPTQYVLDQNYPNPFNPTTVITFGLPKETNVTLEVYNILGMQVRTLIAGERMSAAKYSIEWDGKDNSGMSVPSGVYLYRIHTDKFDAAKKMVLMK